MISKIITLNKNYSTTRLLTKEEPIIENRPDDQSETVLFLPPNPERKGEGGLRTKGYFKNSYKKVVKDDGQGGKEDEWWIVGRDDKLVKKVDFNNSTFNIQHSTLETLPLITIITVVYNGAKYLEETIQSVINQTYPNVEYIIIDGGSTDGTLDIIKKYEDKIDYWVSEKDKGIYDAMNKGILKSNGKWIHILNSDDYYYNKNVLNEISLHLNDERKFYYFTMIQKNNNKENIYKWNSYLWKLWYSAYLPHPTMFVAKKIYDTIGLYDIDFKIAADHDMILRLINNNIKPQFIDIISTVMRMGGLSSLDIKKTFNDFKRVTIKNGLNKYLANFIYQFKITKYRLKDNL